MKNAKKLLAILLAFAFLAVSFCPSVIPVSAETDTTQLAEFTAAMSEKNVLAPGTVDDLSTTDYAFPMMRSGTLPGGVSSIEDSYRFCNPANQATLAAMTQPLGHLMGVANASAFFPLYNKEWAGQALIYKVVENSYIATSLVYLSKKTGVTDEQVAELYGFEYSTDGSVWTSYSTSDLFIENENVWTANTHQYTSTRVVVKIPEGANYYRITCAGYDKTAAGNTYRADGSIYVDGAAAKIQNLVSDNSNFTSSLSQARAGIGGSIASYVDLSQHTTYSSFFVDEMSKKDTLVPGTADNLSTTDYAFPMMRSGTLPGGVTSIEDSYRFCNPANQATLAAMTQPLGHLMGVANASAFFPLYNKEWAGQALIYKVVENSYIATSLVYLSKKTGVTDEQVAELYGFEYSTDGSVWTSYSTSDLFIENENVWTANTHQYTSTRVVVKIPEGANYYRITCAGYDKTAAGNTYRADGSIYVDGAAAKIQNLISDNSNFTSSLSQARAGIGGSIASYYDLSKISSYDTYNSYHTAWKTEMNKKNVLSAGTIDDLSTESFAYKMLRGTKPSAIATEDGCYNIITAPQHDSMANEVTKSMTQPYGHLMGNRNESVIFPVSAYSAWAGQAVCYNVVGGNYVATSLVYTSVKATHDAVWELYGFEYSADGLVWTEFSADEITFELENEWTQGKHQLRSARAVVKIPENANYYRITAAGYDKEKVGNVLKVDGSIYSGAVSISNYLNTDSTTGINCAGIGMSIASNYNLADYTTYGYDITGDENIDVLDFIRAKKALADATLTTQAPFDFNEDTATNGTDLTMLVKFLLCGKSEFTAEAITARSVANDLSPEFTWTALENCTEYDLVIEHYSNGTYSRIAEVNGIDTTSYAIDFELEENELYRYKVYGYQNGKRIPIDSTADGVLFIAKFNPDTHKANTGLDFEFNGTISEEVLRNYLSRSMTSYIFVEDGGLSEFEENLRVILYTGAKYVARAAVSYYPEVSELELFDDYKAYIDAAHAIDPDLIFEAGVFEAIGPQVNEFAIPAYVFEAFGLETEERNFDWTQMTYEDGSKIDVVDGISRPDMSRIETQMWFYYRATSYIDAGFEGLHLGSTPTMSDVDSLNGYAGWDTLTTKIREYAKTNTRRGYVLINAHTINMKTSDNRLIFDYNTWMVCGQVPEDETEAAPSSSNPQELEIELDATGSIYGKTTGGTHPAGWEIDKALYIVELDNYGVLVEQLDKPTTNEGGMYPWGIDEIGWFARQSLSYRNTWLEYAYNRVPEIDSAGYFNIPAFRRMTVLTTDEEGNTVGGTSFYIVNNSDWVYKYNSHSGEDTIRNIWIADNTAN